MLPGFRFLFAAIILSMSILVFGLGAAALLRTAHEEFAANPTWRAAPEPWPVCHAADLVGILCDRRAGDELHLLGPL